QDRVEGIRGFEVGDGIVFAGSGADGDGEEFIAAVEGEDPVGRDAVDIRGGLAEFLATGGGITPELFGGDGGDGCHDARAGRIGVFVGVELDGGGIRRLFAGDVAGGLCDVVTEELHGTGHYREGWGDIRGRET